MKKILWLFVSFAIVCSITFTLAPQVHAISSSGKCGDNLTYTYSSGVLTISGTGKMSDSTYPNYSPFDNDKNIKSVIINEGVTSICTRAFYGCENLTNISLPSTIDQIDGQAFLKTSYYNNQENWEDGVLYIGNHLIEAKDDLSGDYSIKSGTVTIAYMAFDSCINLEEVITPNSLKHIGRNAFSKCSALKNISMSQNIKIIDASAFSGCSNLNKIELPNSVIDIASSAFSGTGYAKNPQNWTDGLLYIGKHLVALQNNYNYHYKYCEIKDGTIDIAWALFEDCSEIRIISIPDSVIHIGKYLTYNCHKLKKIYFSGTQVQWNERIAEPNNDLKMQTIIFWGKHQHSLRVVKENEMVATCTKNGEYVNVSYCEECESEINRDFITISAKGHIFGNWEQIKVATCTEGGKETRTCTKCKYIETKEYDALRHKFSNPTVTKQPTCTETGIESGKCTTCGKTTTNTIAAKGHKTENYVVILEPTCTEDGKKEGTCTVCGAKAEEKVAATGHTYGEAVITKEATETEEGLKTQTCTACGDVIEEIIPVVSAKPDAPADTTVDTDNGESNNLIWIIVAAAAGIIIGGGVTAIILIKKKKA